MTRDGIAEWIRYKLRLHEPRALGKFITEHSETVIAALHGKAELLPMSTCPRVGGVPYVLCVGGVPVVASWDESTWSEPRWSLWLGGDDYRGAPPVFEPKGWWDIEIPQEV